MKNAIQNFPAHVNGDGPDLLSEAISNRNRQMIAWLLSDNVNVNLPDSYGYSPLFRAVAAGSPTIVNKLLKAGAQPNWRHARHGMSPLYLVLVSTHKRRNTIARLLVAAGANLHEQTQGQLSYEELAEHHGNAHLFQELASSNGK